MYRASPDWNRVLEEQNWRTTSLKEHVPVPPSQGWTNAPSPLKPTRVDSKECERSVIIILEREIELKLRKATTDRGGLCLKFTPTNWAGAPDRLVLLPGGRMGFVEVKAPGQCPRPLQVRRHSQLAELGYVVLVLDDPDQSG